MNIKALKESLNEAKEAKKAILNGAITEVRSLEDTENEELRQLDEKIVELQKEIEKAEEEVRSTSVEKTIENKGEIKMEKTQIELREQFMNALATPNADVSKLEMRGAGDGYTAGLGDTPYDATNKGQMNVPLTIEGAIRNAIDFNSDVLGLANVIRTNGTHRIVLDASPASEARLVKEGASISSIDSEFVKVELGAYKYGEIVKFTREVVEDVNFNIVAHAGQRLGMAFAKAFNGAAITFIGQNYGAGNKERVKRIFWICMGMSLVCCGFLNGLFTWQHEFFLSFFSNDANVQAYGKIRMEIVLACQFMASSYEISASALRGMGKSMLPTILTVFGTCLLRIVWVYAVCPVWTSFSTIMLVYPVSWVATGTMVSMAFYLTARKRLSTSTS